MANELVILDKAEIDGFRTSGSSAVEHARDLAKGIVDGATLTAAAEFMLDAKARIKAIEQRLREPKAKARSAWQEWNDLESELTEPFKRIESQIIKPAMIIFEREQQKIRQTEEARLREYARKKAEEEQLERAERAQKMGRADVAQEILEAPTVIEEPVIAPIAEPPAGISYREIADFEVVDQKMIPREYLMVDEKKIGGVVRAMKGETRIPGIRVFMRKTIAGRVS